MALAKKKGWGASPSDVIFAEKIALIHQEVSEALEAYRKGKVHGRNGIAEEFSDIILRTLHLATIYDINIESAIRQKLAINKKRNWNRDQLYIDKRKDKIKICRGSSRLRSRSYSSFGRASV